MRIGIVTLSALSLLGGLVTACATAPGSNTSPTGATTGADVAFTTGGGTAQDGGSGAGSDTPAAADSATGGASDTPATSGGTTDATGSGSGSTTGDGTTSGGSDGGGTTGPVACEIVKKHGCGDTAKGDTKTDGKVTFDAFQCGPGDEPGGYAASPDVTFAFTAPEDTSLTVTILNDGTEGSSLDLFSYAATGATCDSTGCNFGEDRVTRKVSKGETIYVTLDSYTGQSGAYEIEFKCCTPKCDGKTCGSDGCGGACGTCDEGKVCGGAGACIDKPAPVCTSVKTIACDGKLTGEALDGTGSTSTLYDVCDSGDVYPGPEMAYKIDAPVGAHITLTVKTDKPEEDGYDDKIDVVVLATEDGSCNGDSCVAGGITSTEEQILEGKTYHAVVLGYEGTVGKFDLEMACCLPKCDAKKCGDDGCGGSCGTCEKGLFCNAESGACEVETCTAGPAVACNDKLADVASDGDGSTNEVAKYGCIGGDYTGPERVYTFKSETAAKVTIDLPEYDDKEDLDVFVLSADDQGGCNAGLCVDTGTKGATFDAEAGKTYFVVVDGYKGNISKFNLNVTCCVPSCDGKKCGSDGCGGQCGECAETETCAADQASCVTPTYGGNDTCESAKGIDALPFADSGTNAGGANDYTADSDGCGFTSEGGLDVVYSYKAVSAGTIEAWLDGGAAGPKILYVAKACSAKFATCDGFADFISGDKKVSVTLAAGESAYFVVDGFDDGETGPYTFHADLAK